MYVASVIQRSSCPSCHGFWKRSVARSFAGCLAIIANPRNRSAPEYTKVLNHYISSSSNSTPAETQPVSESAQQQQIRQQPDIEMATKVKDSVNDSVNSVTNGNDLKRIGFVETTASSLYEQATQLAYSVAKAAPTPVTNVATSAYEKVSPTVEPYAKKAMEVLKPTASNVLVSVDGKVDYMIKYGEECYVATTKSYEGYKGLLADGTKQFQEHFDARYKAIDDFLQDLKGRIYMPSSKEAADMVSEKLSELRQMLNNASQPPREAVMAKVGQLQSAWESLLERKEVADVIDYSNSSIASLKTKMNDIHDTVVADPRYSSLWDTT
eukprot:scaffold97757_cov45-Prasinocladus_malaysianus.AAC.2